MKKSDTLKINVLQKDIIKKVFIVMRITVCILLLAISSTFAKSSYSQNMRISLHLENATIQQIFDEIQKKSEFIIFYKDDQVNLSHQSNVNVENATVDQILDQALKGTDLGYRIMDRQIVISSNKMKEFPSLEKSITTAEQKKEISGTVKDTKGLPLPGVTVVVKGSTIGTITDIDGKFKLTVPSDTKVLVFSFIGMKTQEFLITGKTIFLVVMAEEVVAVEDVVVVGYGIQKKASVVGAITTTSSKELQRSGGVPNLAAALTGNLPGLTTIQTTGQPGMEDPKIYIRGQSTWNGGQPYILVDGVERRMNDLDMSEVDNISVLKDASATAVYGVKGANGVILITTKRGYKGKPILSVSANSSMKIPSRLVDKLDSYDTYLVRNAAIEREVVINEGEWPDYTPLTIVNRYRNQENLKYPEAYPNVNWQKETVKDFAMDHRVNLNVAGGTDFAKYFSSLAYIHEGDLLKTWDNGRGYTPGFGYDKFNFRTNLDLNLTKTTTLKINLAGIYGAMKKNASAVDVGAYILAQYSLPPDAFMPRYANGRWGMSTNTDFRMSNSAAIGANSGYDLVKTTDLTTDLSVTQKLDCITQGLSAFANLSFDNHFEAISRIVEVGGQYPTEYIRPGIEDMPPNGDPNSYIILGPVTGTNQFSWIYKPWVAQDENAANSLSTLRRRLYFQAQINYARTFGKQDITATGVFTREQLATGSEFQRYREDWVSRITYNYSNKYFAEFNGAYNGSEKFGPAHRFAFFPSAAVGWTLSNEQFMKNIQWLDKLKLRYSYGLIGDDGSISNRWLYASQYSYGGNVPLNEFPLTNINISPYTIYRESVVGNPDVHWEKAKKSDLGLEMAVLKNMFSANVEYFTEDRTDILLLGSSRILPPYYGTDAPTANVGRVTKKGYEVELRFNKNLRSWHFWANASMTHAVDKIVEKEEPELKDQHLKAKGFQIDQTRSLIRDGFINTWNDVYASTPYLSNDKNKLPGDYNILDFNGDGVIDGNKDTAPYGFSIRPQNNYNFSFGTDYKGFSIMLQFYGVNNVTRGVTFDNFVSNIDLAYATTLDHWSKDNTNATSFLPRWKTSGGSNGEIYQFDGSYLRLKTAELAYTFSGDRLKRSGMSSLKLYLNGNNLLFWSKLPDDREQGGERYGAYPTSRRINLGIDIKF
jgi:TonB-linked SusC/RagA family outer membrane protein